MRAWIALTLVAFGLLLAPPPAVAGSLACDLEGPSTDDFMEPLWPLLDEASDDALAVLGDQAAGYWISNRERGWAMGIAPGSLTLEHARSAIAARIRAHLAPDDAERVLAAFLLYAMPYSDLELRAVLDPLDAQLADELSDRVAWTAGIGCLDGEAWRVEVGLYSDATRADIAKVRELAAPYGDLVRVYLDGLVEPPSAGGGTTADRLRSFIKLRSPKRCVPRSTITLKTRKSARPVIRRITVTVAGKRRSLTDGVRLTIRLRRRVTPVRVVVRAGDGSRLAHTYRFRRC